MRLPATPTAAALLLLPALASAAESWGCTTVQDGVTYNFSTLKGRHSLVTLEQTPPSVRNTTWQVSPCGPIEHTKEEKEKPKEQCPPGTWVCGLQRFVPEDGKSHLDLVIPVAGDVGEKKVDEKVERLPVDDKNKDRKGIRLTLGGGVYDKHEQRAVIEFVCDKERTGLETKDEKKKEEGDKKKKEEDSSLRYISYESDGKTYTLLLEWRTKYACEDAPKDDPKKGDDADKASGWGFFTWIFIICFMGIAAYLIFSSWLSYNRFGARGWDLVPHNDTLRDIPYLLKDFARRVVTTLQGRSSRGGYSAV